MNGRGKGSTPDSPADKGGDRARGDRLKAALRANLRRRKAPRHGAPDIENDNDPEHPGGEGESRTDG